MTEALAILINPRLLMQDTSRELTAWFASKVDARQSLRRARVDQKTPFLHNVKSVKDKDQQ